MRVMTRAHLKILAVDANMVNLQLLESVLGNAGHIVSIASSDAQAMSRFEAQCPDLVLLNVSMQGMGGIELTRRLRALKSERWVPIILISDQQHREIMVRALEAGGDDFLAMPIDIVLLVAKINASQRIAVLEYKLRVSNLKLQSYRDKAERDLEIARELIEQMVKYSTVKSADVELWLQPAANPRGDLLLGGQYESNRGYLMFADAMGQGLPAVFPLIPLVQIFSDKVRMGDSVAGIIREMNASLANLLPLGHFVAVTLISWDRSRKTLEMWNGGNPPVLVTNGAGKIIQRFESGNISLGICSDGEFDTSTEVFSWHEACRLTLCSKGVGEAENVSGIKFGEHGIVAALQQHQSHRGLKEAILAHLGNVSSIDDIAIASISLQ